MKQSAAGPARSLSEGEPQGPLRWVTLLSTRRCAAPGEARLHYVARKDVPLLVTDCVTTSPHDTSPPGGRRLFAVFEDSVVALDVAGGVEAFAQPG